MAHCIHLLARFLVPALGKPLVILLPLLLRRSECALFGSFELRAKQTGTHSSEAKPQNARSVSGTQWLAASAAITKGYRYLVLDRRTQLRLIAPEVRQLLLKLAVRSGSPTPKSKNAACARAVGTSV